MAGHDSRSLSTQEVISTIDRAIKREFDSNRSVLSFDEYLSLVGEAPQYHLRGSAKYALDMLDHAGTSQTAGPLAGGSRHFKLFDAPIDGLAPKIIGHERVENQIYSTLKSFVQQGLNSKLLLLHGPNGSAKSSIVHSLMGGMERFSHEPQGAVYRYNWIFPVERLTRGGMGLSGNSTSSSDRLDTFAKLLDDDVAARIPCDLRDHPILLIPQAHRKPFLDKLLGSGKADELWPQLPHYLTRGEPCHRCKEIFDSLLTANGGDLKKVLRHIQVERFYFSRRYRNGLVTIEPQMHVDAHTQQLTMNRSLSALPASLQSLNLFSLSGDLIECNRGLIEFSDLLKRPLDSFKYLLGLCETGRVNVGSTIAALDTILIGSTNEIQLDAFKEMPDFTSFKARIELVRVPYLLKVHQERDIYDSQMSQFGGERHVAPHVGWSIALWSVLTRLKKPNSVNFPPSVGALASQLSPLDKAKLYDTGEVPQTLSPEDRKVLKANVRRIFEEYENIPYYEGRMGASVREMKSVIFEAAQDSEFPCLSPLAVLRKLEDFIKHVSEYEFLKQEVKDGYHDAQEFIATVRGEYLNIVDREVRDSMGIYETTAWEEFLKRYVHQISLIVKREKTKNSITGKMEDPDISMVEEFEKIVDAPGNDPEAILVFRQNVISQVGAWSLDHTGQPVVYASVFPEYWKKLEHHYFESQKALLLKVSEALLERGSPSPEGVQLANQTIGTMQKKLGYCPSCAKEVVSFLLKQRY